LDQEEEKRKNVKFQFLFEKIATWSPKVRENWHKKERSKNAKNDWLKFFVRKNLKFYPGPLSLGKNWHKKERRKLQNVKFAFFVRFKHSEGPK
jgi:hypothetical protein